MKTQQLLGIVGCSTIVLLSVSGCIAPTPTATSIPLTQTPPYVLTNTPIAESTPTTEPYQTWSTNFADVTDPSALWIVGDGNNPKLSLDTSNVHSGGKSIKLAGTVGAYWSWLNLVFNFKPLTGANSIDLSDKTIDLEMYIPAGSPLSEFLITIHSMDQNNVDHFVQVRTILPDVYLGQWHTYSVDVREDIALKTWHERPIFTSSPMTDDQVINILKNAQNIDIYPVVTVEQPSAEAYFMVDQLGWAPSGSLPVYDPAVDSLRKFAPASLPMGAYLESNGSMDRDYLSHLVQDFNLINTGVAFPQTEPAGDVLTYDSSWSLSADADYFQDTDGIPLLRYSGLGQDPSWIPDWLPKKSYADTQTILGGYIDSVVDHYKGKTFIWVLFNELLRYDLVWKPYTGLGLKDRDQSPQTYVGNYSPWSDSPSDLNMIEDAFRVAKQADPQALLFINDGCGVEGQPWGDALYNLAARLKADGTPIDGVGLETHIFLDQHDHFYATGYLDPKSIIPFDSTYGFTDIAENVERFEALGLKVAFTEADFPIYTKDIDLSTQAGKDLLAHRRQLQAEAYRSLLHIALTHPNVVAFITYDWADEYTYADPARGTWYQTPGFVKDLGLMDQVYQKKPSYDAMLDELRATPASLPGFFPRTSPTQGAVGLPTSLTLSWDSSSGATEYQYCLVAGSSDRCNSWTSTGTNTNVSLSGLRPNTSYSWQVRAFGPGGVIHGNNGNWGTFKTAG